MYYVGYYGGDSDKGLLKKYTVKVLHLISGSSQTSTESNSVSFIKNFW